MRWNPLPSLKVALQFLLLAMMESAWIIALVAMLTTLVTPMERVLPLPSWSIILMWWGAAVPVAFFAVRHRFLSLLASLLLASAALYAGLAVRYAHPDPTVILAKLPGGILSAVAFATLLAFMRGLIAGTQQATGLEGLADGRLFGRFRLGLTIIGVTTIISLLLGIGGSETLLGQAIGGQILSFLVFALVNLAWANLDETSIELANRRAQNGGAPRRTTWLLGGGVIIMLIVIMGGLLGGVADSPLGTLFQIVSSLAIGLGIVFSFVVGSIVGLIVPVVDFIIGSIRGLTHPVTVTSSQNQRNGAPLNLSGLFKSLDDLSAEENTRLVVFWAVSIGLLIFILWVVALLAIRKLIADPKSSRTNDTVRVRFGTWSLFWQQLKAWLQELWIMLLKRLGLWREPLPVGMGEVAQYSGPEGQRLRDIRQIYRRFQKVAARAGQPRRGHITPREFLSQLQLAYAELPPAAITLTQTYIAARYGNRAPSVEQVQAANAALTELERFFSSSPPPTQLNAPS